ncbi:hypothetical protein [Shewanella fidelis]|uniref:hypothetical protein n=1 Tax=Shewanella fidelis TaxID=173509 RepID=UPI00048FF28A|nr:hypothetical protein [Shewanella fidelis]
MNKPRLMLLSLTSLLISSTANASLETQLTQCAAVQDKLERLICYDKISSSLSSKTKISSTTETIAAAAPTAAATTTAIASNPSEDFGQIYKTEDTIEKIQLQIKSIAKDPRGVLKISFTNGQVWKQTDTTRLKLKDGQTVYIEKAALGSFMLGTDGRNTTIRVKRLK